jgi:pimeloyl-ACP methyl ester carboxylesterase
MATKLNAVTGAIRHSLGWLFSSVVDIVTPNPRFKTDVNNPNNRGTAIYCVHGTADVTNAFSRITKGLLPDLPKEVSAIHQLSFKGRWRGKDIPYFAQQLIDKVIANGDKEVILTGHSRGGLIAAYAAEKLARAKGIKVKGVMPICSPFRGSQLAVAPLAWMSKSVQQMQPGSDFLKDLEQLVDESHPDLLKEASASEQASDRAQYLFFVAENDMLVSHDSSFIHRKNAIVVPLDGHGHLSMMTSNRIVGFMKNFLKRLFPQYKVNLEERNPAHFEVTADGAKIVVGEHENIILKDGEFFRQHENAELEAIKEFENIDICKIAQFLDNDELRVAYLEKLLTQPHSTLMKDLTRNMVDWYFEKDATTHLKIINELALTPYQLEKARLERILHDDAHHLQREPALQLLIEMERLSPAAKKMHLPVLTEILQRTSRAIKNPERADNLQRYEQIIRTHNENNMQNVIKAMVYVVAGVAMIAISTAIAVASFGAATLPSILGVMLGVGLLAKALAIVNIAFAVGMVAKGSHGLANKESPINKVAEKTARFWQASLNVESDAPDTSSLQWPNLPRNSQS